MTEGEAEVLLSLQSPLDDFYKDYEKLETDYKDSIQGCLKSRITDVMKARRNRFIVRIAESYHVCYNIDVLICILYTKHCFVVVACIMANAFS